MNTLPDYSRFHVHELKDRLKALDPLVDQEEILEIQKWIDKGGYQFPSTNATETKKKSYSNKRRAVRIKFHSLKFLRWLVALLTLSLLWNLYAMLFLGLSFALISIAFDGVILYCLYKRHPTSKLLVKIWAGWMAVSSSISLIALLIKGTPLPDLPWINVFFVGIAIYVWKKATQSMEVIYSENEQPD